LKIKDKQPFVVEKTFRTGLTVKRGTSPQGGIIEPTSPEVGKREIYNQSPERAT
jgi:hypothetical protein